MWQGHLGAIKNIPDAALLEKMHTLVKTTAADGVKPGPAVPPSKSSVRDLPMKTKSTSIYRHALEFMITQLKTNAR